MPQSRYADRIEAGARLAPLLGAYRYPGPIVLGMARGGVVVAAEVARRLGAPLDVLVVRKLGAPRQPELAIGALADRVIELDDLMIHRLGVTPPVLDRIIAREREELVRRERLYRQGRPSPTLEGRTVILVDDGLATGLSALAGVAAVRACRPTRLVFATPVCSQTGRCRVAAQADEIVCGMVPPDLIAVGQWYLDFRPTSDQEVIDILSEAANRAVTGPV